MAYANKLIFIYADKNYIKIDAPSLTDYIYKTVYYQKEV